MLVRVCWQIWLLDAFLGTMWHDTIVYLIEHGTTPSVNTHFYLGLQRLGKGQHQAWQGRHQF